MSKTYYAHLDVGDVSLMEGLGPNPPHMVQQAPKHSHYFKDVSQLQKVDWYRVCDLFGVVHPCAQHAGKKIAFAGQRGAKDVDKDIQEAIDTLLRWQEMRREESKGG